MLQWKDLYKECKACSKCNLGEERINMVFGEGNPKAKLMFIGEAPGADEDRTGRPFVGRAGQLLTKGLLELNLHRDKDYYITNICKCRPENNRNPMEHEAYACIPYLRNQVGLIKPKIIVCLGAIAGKYIINLDLKITRDRGKWVEKKGIYIMPIFHPAAILRDDHKKSLFWRDLKEIKKMFDEIK
ncbi:uracil-DNA glycosylase [Clostridium botulinum]|uniref:Type-4 uracil-DNA glycosylase n=1 Tax=Clostridium botulinum C/D str. DC5 TaxID=1443128 RepID=A0A0A0I9Y1_CLOBO|nr:uracil-DNA glycosylase [Clostridium botulinum]KEI06791.1 DNA polymerase [Clostridium botulinum C/D str. BKT75002]KEI10901.1 DNA polymerase [Clostridium botulinum C/D str. BKT2873]KGM93468.1 DNA polymerase [Clostridium botulinum D str. CCUG 7971]KGM97702.1 DNA polymerase [Clostridium botulinum C/D str. DC5]KOC49179.1 DNA polymerase [Clostridium botulinum]